MGRVREFSLEPTHGVSVETRASVLPVSCCTACARMGGRHEPLSRAAFEIASLWETARDRQPIAARVALLELPMLAALEGSLAAAAGVATDVLRSEGAEDTATLAAKHATRLAALSGNDVDALLAAWLDVMGHVVRDPAVLHNVLVTVRVGDVHVRRSLVVALGLLGEPVSPDVGLDDARDPASVDAYIFAASLTGLAPALEAASVAYRLAGSAAASVAADTSLARIEAGDVFGVIG